MTAMSYIPVEERRREHASSITLWSMLMRLEAGRLSLTSCSTSIDYRSHSRTAEPSNWSRTVRTCLPRVAASISLSWQAYSDLWRLRGSLSLRANTYWLVLWSPGTLRNYPTLRHG